jgi:hypothetical protein
MTEHSSKNNIILSTERLDIEGEELLRRKGNWPGALYLQGNYREKENIRYEGSKEVKAMYKKK